MGFRVSPGVSIKEVDLTTIVPAVATTPGGFAGYFHWGPVNEIVTVANERELSNIFQKPDNNNYVDFFTPANFLQYGNSMQVVRVVGATAYNSQTNKAGACAAAGFNINNETDFYANEGVSGGSALAVNGVLFTGKYPGVLGNSLKVVLTSGTGTTTGYTLAASASQGATYIDIGRGNLNATAIYFAKGDEITFNDGTSVTVDGIQKGDTTTGGLFGITATFGDFYGVTSGYTLAASGPYVVRVLLNSLLPIAQSAGNTVSIKSVYAKYVSTGATTSVYASDAGGGNDLVNVLVLDKDGKWTGTANTILEKWEGLSRASDARNFDGSSNYYRTVVNDQSNYVWAISSDPNTTIPKVATDTNYTLLGPALSTTSAVGAGVNSLGLTGGSSIPPTDSDRWSSGWSLFQDADTVDVSLLPTGNASATLAQLIVQQICEKRLDCMAFVSPLQTNVENKLPYEALNNLKTFRDSTFNVNSSYAVLDSGWKYQLDTYNNLVRLVPLNADIAGLVARTEFTNEAWFSPAGFNRGQIKSVVKLAYNPSSEAHRDELYTRQVNPVVSFPGEGVILYGDKTMQTRPSAFDRINVRRLFIILEKAIATASKFFLFEQNDGFTRAQFKNLVVPFLKTVQQRRGITDFKVVCDETNNTGEVIDRNEFVADIFVKPTRSINFIQLNFIATKTGVNFSEVGG
jgi:phage tail sheath protein FI